MVSRKSAKWYRRQSYYRVGHALTNAISPEIGSECWDGQNQQFSQNVRFRAVFDGIARAVHCLRSSRCGKPGLMK